MINCISNYPLIGKVLVAKVLPVFQNTISPLSKLILYPNTQRDSNQTRLVTLPVKVYGSDCQDILKKKDRVSESFHTPLLHKWTQKHKGLRSFKTSKIEQPVKKTVHMAFWMERKAHCAKYFEGITSLIAGELQKGKLPSTIWIEKQMVKERGSCWNVRFKNCTKSCY